MNIEYEDEIHKLMTHAARHDAVLKAQEEQILQLSQRLQQTQTMERQRLHSQEPEPPAETITRAISSNNVAIEPHDNFAILAAKIDTVIRVSEKKEGQNKNTKTVIENQQKSDPIREKIIPVTEHSNRTHSPKYIDSRIEKIHIIPSKPSENIKTDAPEEESSSDFSPEVKNIEVSSMYGLADKNSLKQKQRSSHRGSNIKDSLGNLQGSKDSGLDSPKREPYVSPITKVTTFHKSAPVSSVTQDRGVERESQDEDIEDEEETLSGEEETNEEIETETESEREDVDQKDER